MDDINKSSGGTPEPIGPIIKYQRNFCTLWQYD